MGLMRINNWDISLCNARLWNVTIGHCDLANQSTISDASLIPVLVSGQVELKKVMLTLLVKGDNRDHIIRNRSTLLSKFLNPVTLEMDWFSHTFYGVMTKHSETENSKRKFHTVKIEFEGVEISEEAQSVLDKKEMTLHIPGNLPAPVVLEITPIEGTSILTVSGCSNDPIIIKKTNRGKKIIIDGLTGKMTEDGVNKAADIEIWELPRLMPGENTITLDYAADITVCYQARYI